jgi:hypothetical protein
VDGTVWVCFLSLLFELVLIRYRVVLGFVWQTITGAMNVLSPPIALEKPENQWRVDYIQDVASQPNFNYPSVSIRHFKQTHLL